MSWLIDTLGRHTALLLAALLLGHVLADFVFQSRSMVERKTRLSGLLKHGLLVFLVHALVFFPFLSPRAVIVLLAVGVLHLLIDQMKILVERRKGPLLSAFLVDQALHVGVLLAAAMFLSNDPPRYEITQPGLFITGAVVLSGAAFLGTGGSAVTRLVLDGLDIVPKDGAPKAGHMIGILERLLVFLFALVGQWAAAVLVVAVKSLARFESLKKRDFAEYYLVGTLTSVLIAALVGVLVRLLVL